MLLLRSSLPWALRIVKRVTKSSSTLYGGLHSEDFTDLETLTFFVFLSVEVSSLTTYLVTVRFRDSVQTVISSRSQFK